MSNFKKHFNLKILSIVLSLLLLGNEEAFCFSPEYIPKDKLRVPVGEGFRRFETVASGETLKLWHSPIIMSIVAAVLLSAKTISVDLVGVAQVEGDFIAITSGNKVFHGYIELHGKGGERIAIDVVSGQFIPENTRHILVEPADGYRIKIKEAISEFFGPRGALRDSVKISNATIRFYKMKKEALWKISMTNRRTLPRFNMRRRKRSSL